MFTTIFLIVLGLLTMWGIIHLMLAQARFSDKFIEVELLLPNVTTFVEGMLMINDLAQLSWHRTHHDKVKQLYAYLRGRFNIREPHIVV